MVAPHGHFLVYLVSVFVYIGESKHRFDMVPVVGFLELLMRCPFVFVNLRGWVGEW